MSRGGCIPKTYLPQLMTPSRNRSEWCSLIVRLEKGKLQSRECEDMNYVRTLTIKGCNNIVEAAVSKSGVLVISDGTSRAVSNFELKKKNAHLGFIFLFFF